MQEILTRLKVPTTQGTTSLSNVICVKMLTNFCVDTWPSTVSAEISTTGLQYGKVCDHTATVRFPAGGQNHKLSPASSAAARGQRMLATVWCVTWSYEKFEELS